MARPDKDPRDREELARLQGQRLRAMLAEVLPANAFYGERFARANIPPAGIRTPSDLSRLPFITKADLLADQAAHPPYGRVLTYPLERYSRMHQTSGTSGKPLRWLDTPESWDWCLDCWRATTTSLARVQMIAFFSHSRSDHSLVFGLRLKRRAGAATFAFPAAV